ncbi:unnamed protein product [Calypogeia fissa]
MVGCLNFSLVEYYQRRLQVLYRSCGLESRLVDLEDGTIMKCWIPQRNKERAIAMATSNQKPPVVLLHAFGSSANSWNYQVKPFSKFFDLYIPDLVFFGDSTTSRTERSEFFQADCIVKMLQQLSVPKYSVVGTSYGGFVAYRIAHMYPDSVDKLVISSSGVIMDSSSNQRLIDKFKVNSIKDILLPTTVEGMRRVAGLAFHRQLPFPIPRFIMEDYLEHVLIKNYKEREELTDSLVLGKDESPPLPIVPQDVLIIWGEFDEIFNVQLAHQLKEHIGDKAKVVVMKNCAHVPQVEKASEYNKHVLCFLTNGQSDVKASSPGRRFPYRMGLPALDKTDKTT